MELARVPVGEWAQVFGHERGFTYGVYNPDGITLERAAQIIELIDYPALDLPQISPLERDGTTSEPTLLAAE
jgi:hypothetical protein